MAPPTLIVIELAQYPECLVKSVHFPDGWIERCHDAIVEPNAIDIPLAIDDDKRRRRLDVDLALVVPAVRYLDSSEKIEHLRLGVPQRLGHTEPIDECGYATTVRTGIDAMEHHDARRAVAIRLIRVR